MRFYINIPEDLLTDYDKTLLNSLAEKKAYYLGYKKLLLEEVAIARLEQDKTAIRVLMKELFRVFSDPNMVTEVPGIISEEDKKCN